MPAFAVLLRGVNVGGGNRVPMAEFRALLEGLGYTGVRTLLNSGNAVFRAAAGPPVSHAARIAEALADALDVRVPVIVKTAREVAAIVAGNPLTVSADLHAKCLVVFTQRPADLTALRFVEALVTPPERFAIGDRAAYLVCPRGISQSDAALALLGKAGRSVTTRNLATTLKLLALLQPSSEKGRS
ncbi:MAG: DUF1697 domain-containing protein [Vicinamibacterales bacterium]